MRYSEMWPKYAAWWDRMEIKKDRAREFEDYANYAIGHKDIYQEVEKRTTHGRVDVHWYHVAVLHRREDPRFDRYLGNGQSLYRRTTIVPKGRGPFPRRGEDAREGFIRGCLDALIIDGVDKVIDWRLEKILYFAEVFNGGGYARRGLPSPYNCGTNIQRPGKFVADRAFRSNVWDVQPGCAPLLWMIAKLDPSVQFVRET